MAVASAWPAERRVAGLLLSAGACYRSISCSPGAQQQTCWRLLLLSIERQTADGRT